MAEIYEKVQKVEKLKKNYRIYWQNHEPMIVSEDFLVQYRLLKDKEFTQEDFIEMKKNMSSDQAYEQALRWISYQMRTIQEVDQYLKEKNHKERVRAKVIRQLIDYGWLNDLEYAQCYMRTKRREGKKGPRAIAYQLKEKGISENDIFLSQKEYPREKEYENAKKQAEKLQLRYQKKSIREQKEKIRQKLYQDGFQSDIIQEVCSELEFSLESELENMRPVADRYWKKYQKYDEYTRKEKLKMMLYRKGYASDDIQQYLQEKEEEQG